MTESERMVADQILRRGVTSSRVLDAMRKIRRHEFVPESLRSQAYGDGPLPIGRGQTISQPYIVAYMTELLRVGRTDRILEVGTGSGYQTAVLAELAERVFSVELIDVLSLSASRLLGELGYGNIEFRIGDGALGWPEHAPFDGIIVTAAASRVPPALVEQLGPEGRMVVPVGEPFEIQDLVLVKKEGGRISSRSQLQVRFVPLREGEGLNR